MAPHRTPAAVTQRIIDCSRGFRQAYLSVARKNAGRRVECTLSSYTNLAHGFAAMSGETKIRLKALERPDLGIISAYSDMLSAHQPLEVSPAWLKQVALDVDGTTQFADGAPAMCDGVTQGQDGMKLSLFSRNTIALSAVAVLSHQMLDAALYLGVCDKIVPGLVVGALSFGHLPAVFVPTDPMTTGVNNDEKARTRQLYAEGRLSRVDLLKAESKPYRDPGTCTFYGTASPNQMLMEVMGPYLPGTTFINPNIPLREAFARGSARQALKLIFDGDQYTPIVDVLDERAFVNGIAGLLATGGSASHTLHLIAMARVTDILFTWGDFNDLSSVIPLLACAYPNGKADVSEFQAASGLSTVIRELISTGLLRDDATTIMDKGLRRHARGPFLGGEKLIWRDGVAASLDTDIVCDVTGPFSPDSDLRMLEGNVGCLVVRVSAVKPEHRFVEASTHVFLAQDDLINAFKTGELECDFVAVLPYQGPVANGIPELHKLTPTLSVLQERDFKVAPVTGGRILGASGKVPATIRIISGVLNDGPLAHVCGGDTVVPDTEAGTLQVRVPEAEWNIRQVTTPDLSHYHASVRRDLFSGFHRSVSAAREGAYALFASAGV